MNLIYKLRTKFDEPYRIRTGWGLSPIRNNRELKALIQFCEGELGEMRIDLNPERGQVFNTTITLYRNNDPELHYYINDNIGWYWS